jgi:flagellar hook protein FlgE
MKKHENKSKIQVERNMLYLCLLILIYPNAIFSSSRSALNIDDQINPEITPAITDRVDRNAHDNPENTTEFMGLEHSEIDILKGYYDMIEVQKFFQQQNKSIEKAEKIAQEMQNTLDNLY